MPPTFPGQVLTGETYTPNADWLLNPESCAIKGVPIDPAARDATNTPTTTLRSGLVMGIVTATKKWKEYDNTDGDGTEVAAGILLAPVKLLDPFGNAVVSPVHGQVVMGWARVRAANLIGSNADGITDLKAAGHGFIFEADFE